MKIRLFIVLLFLVTAANAQTPKQMKASLANTMDSLKIYVEGLGEALASSVQTKNYSLLKKADSSMIAFISSKEEMISQMKDVGNSKALRRAVLDFLKMQKGLPLYAKNSFEKFNADTSPKTVETTFSKLQEITQGEEQALKDIDSLSIKFNKDNGLQQSPSFQFFTMLAQRTAKANKAVL